MVVCGSAWECMEVFVVVGGSVYGRVWQCVVVCGIS